MFIRVFFKWRQPAKKPAAWRFEPSTFGRNKVKWDSKSLKLPTALCSYQVAYFYILAVYTLKINENPVQDLCLFLSSFRL